MDIAQLTKALQKSHITLLSNDETRFYSSAVLMGRSEIVEHVPTACTNGVDKLYGYEFMRTKKQEEVTGIALHENLHVMLKHNLRFGSILRSNHKVANAAMDYVVNGIIHKLKGYGQWISLPDPHLYDAKFDNWSVNEVYEFLMRGRKPDGEQEVITSQMPPDASSTPGAGQEDKQEDGEGDGEGEGEGEGEGDDEGESDDDGTPNAVSIGGKDYSLVTQDEHVRVERSKEQIEQLEEAITEAIQQSAALAGVLGANMPRVFMEAAVPKVDWREEIMQFFSEFTRGTEEYSWRRYDRRRLVDDTLSPTRYDERIKEITFAVDASGSMFGELFDKAVTAVVDAVQVLNPEQVRVLFWDTDICSDQVFVDDYESLRQHLVPRGGGGTRAACVVEHMERNGYDPACVVVITDGYLEHDLKWETYLPTLWLVLQSEQFVPPSGRKVKVSQ